MNEVEVNKLILTFQKFYYRKFLHLSVCDKVIFLTLVKP
jgi:hypothetical protein